MWWESMDILQRTMFIIACAATVILIVQIIAMLVGGDVEADVSADVSDVTDVGDVDIDTDADGAADVSVGGGFAHFGFRLLSLRSILAFLAVGGWVGYTVGYALDWYFALLVALAAGIVAACAMAGGIIGIEKLQANGTVKPETAIGKSGTVYLVIPPKRSGNGKVSILVSEKYTEYEAVTDSEEPLPTGTAVTVIAHLGDNVLLVKKIRANVTIKT